MPFKEIIRDNASHVTAPLFVRQNTFPRLVERRENLKPLICLLLEVSKI